MIWFAFIALATYTFILKRTCHQAAILLDKGWDKHTEEIRELQKRVESLEQEQSKVA